MFSVMFFFVVLCVYSFVIKSKALKNYSNIDEITCDRLQGLPLNETFCVCQMSDTKNLVDLRSFAWSMTDKNRKNPRFVAKDEYKGWYAGWSPCSAFSMYTDVQFAACYDAAFGIFENVTNYCETEGYHSTSDFKVISADPKAAIRLEIRFRDPEKPGYPVMNIIRLACDKKAKIPEFRFSHKNTFGTKIFNFTCSVCCEGGGSIHTPEPPDSSNDQVNYKTVIGASVGSFVLVVVLMCAAVYKYRHRHGYNPIVGQQGAQPGEHEEPQQV